MAVKVTIKGGPPDIMEIVRELRSQGYTQGIDFDFAFFQRDWDMETYQETSPYANFIFYNDKYGTLFSLKYSDRLL